MWLRINTDTEQHGKELASFLKSIGYIKSVEIEDDSKELNDIDWILPGRPATKKELKNLSEIMDNDGEGVESDEFFKDLKNRLTG